MGHRALQLDTVFDVVVEMSLLTRIAVGSPRPHPVSCVVIEHGEETWV